MSNWKFYSICETCPKKGFFVRRRELTIPQMHQKALSKKRMCGECFDKIKRMLDNNK